VTLWLDQLYHGAIAVMATQSSVYQVFLVIVIIVCYLFLTQGRLIRPLVVANSLAFNGMFFISILLVPIDAISGLVCGEIGVEVPHDGVPHSVCSVPHWVGSHVRFGDIPMDFRSVGFLRRDGIRFGAAYPYWLHRWYHVSLELRQGLGPLL
jgi:hypothetical protein